MNSLKFKYLSFGILPFLLIVVSCSMLANDVNHSDKDDDLAEIIIDWDRENVIKWRGDYARVHRLNDSRLIAVYESGGKAYYRYSNDNGYNWTLPKIAIDRYPAFKGSISIWTNNANAECLQLNRENPYHPGRIIYAVNIRPSDSRSDIFPYSIAYAVSDDNGNTWSDRKIAYQSSLWPSPAFKGCWEPFLLELPDGTIQIYFADETPYYEKGQSYQNISVIESKDGGDSWGEARIVSYTSGMRDGMPVVITYQNNIYMVIEHYRKGEYFHPQIVWNSISDNWKETVTGDSEKYRFDPFQNPLDYSINYYGAPYIITTDKYFVISYQSSEGSGQPTDTHSVMEVAVCLKSECESGTFKTMRSCSRPVIVDQTNNCARWNSLCDLGDDNILAVSDVSGSIYLTRGKIVCK